MAATESGDPNSAVIVQFFEAMERGDLEIASRFVHDDIVMEWPQSGERFRGRENALAAVRSQTDKPEVAAEPRMLGAGNVWVMMMPLRYGTEIHHYVGVFELEDGRVKRTTEFFGAPFPAQEFRAQFTDRG